MTVLQEQIIPNNGRSVTTIKNGRPTRHAAVDIAELVAPAAAPVPTPVPALVRNARRAAVLITGGIALVSFVLSFTGLRDLAARSGIPHSLAWLWPLVVDGTILQATVAIIALAAYAEHARARRFFWLTLTTAALASVGGNIAHAVIAGPVPPVLAALVAASAPVSLLAATHGLAGLLRFTPRPT